MTTPKKVDVTYDAGWLVCRQIGVDESDGEARDVPGCHLRIKCDRVEAYSQEGPGIVDVYLKNCKTPFTVVGSHATIAQVLKRHALTAYPVQAAQ